MNVATNPDARTARPAESDNHPLWTFDLRTDGVHFLDFLVVGGVKFFGRCAI